MSETRKRILYGIPLLLLLITFAIKAISYGYSDFAAYYFGSIELLNGNYANAYDTAMLNGTIRMMGYQNLFISYTPFPPFTAFFFAPFTLLPIGSAKITFNILSCIIFVISLYRSFRHFSITPIYLLLIPIVFFTPIRSNLYFGQCYLLLFSLLIEGYIAYDKKQPILSSLWWGIAILLKVFPALILFYLLFKKEYKNTVYLGVSCSLLLIASTICVGIGPWKLYVFELIPRLNNGELNDSYTFIFQSGFMLLKNIFVYESVLNPEALFPNLYLFCITLAVFKTLILGICIASTQNKIVNSIFSFSSWILASILISPNGSTYSQILVLIPVIAIFQSTISLKWKLIIAGLSLLICNIPVLYFSEAPLLLKFPRFYLLILLFILISIVSQVRFNFRIIAGLLLLFIGLESTRLFVKPDSSSWLVSDNKHLMTYSYELKNNSIIRYFWEEKGVQKDTILYKKVVAYSYDDVTIKDNQIYYKGLKITNSPDWKRAPAMLNDEYIIYLSDKNKGVGFYALRKIKIHAQ